MLMDFVLHFVIGSFEIKLFIHLKISAIKFIYTGPPSTGRSPVSSYGKLSYVNKLPKIWLKT